MTQFHAGRLAGKVTPETLQAQLNRLERIVNQEISFGHPHHPTDLSSTDPAGRHIAIDGASIIQHNGVLDNIRGSWVEVPLTGNGRQNVLCSHNLYINDPTYTLPYSGQANVRWMLWGTMQDGFGGGADNKPHVYISHVQQAAQPPTANAITLTFEFIQSGALPYINPDSDHPLRVTLFFIKADGRATSS